MEELNEGNDIEDEPMYFENEDVNINEKGLAITRKELYKALNDLTNKIATGVNEIPAEVLQNLDNATTEKLSNIITDCYERGKISSDYYK